MKSRTEVQEDARREADRTGGPGGTFKSALTHVTAAERHAFGAAGLIEDAMNGTDSALEVALVAARTAEREALLCRGLLQMPGPLLPADERHAAAELVRMALAGEEVLPRSWAWLLAVIERDGS